MDAGSDRQSGGFQRHSSGASWAIVVVCMATIALVTFATLPLERWETDFLSFYAGAKLLGSPHLYSVQHARQIQADITGKPDEVRAFIRPPFYAVLMWPLGRFPYRTALVAWELLNLAALLCFILLWSPGPLRFPICCFYFPLWLSFIGGQDIPLVLLCYAASASMLARGGDFAAGVVLALCGAKFHVFALLPLVIIARRLWRLGLGLGVGAIVLLAVSFAVAGWQWPVQYLHLLQANELGQASQSQMPNLTGLFHALPFGLVLVILASLGVLFATWYVASRVPERYALSFALFGGLIVSPHAYLQDCSFLLPFLLSLSERRLAERTVFLSIALGLSSLTLFWPAVSIVAQLVVVALFAGVTWAVYRTSSQRIPSLFVDPSSSNGEGHLPHLGPRS